MRALNRAAVEMQKYYKYETSEEPTFSPGSGGQPTLHEPVPTVETPPVTKAPQASIEFLKADPSEYNLSEFKKKYGYLPEGF